MKKLLLSLMLLTGCTVNNDITNTSSAVNNNSTNTSIVVVDEEKKLVDTYVSMLVECYQWDNYAYTYQKLEGVFNLKDTKNTYLITVYTGDEKLEFICWESSYELEWENVDYE